MRLRGMVLAGLALAMVVAAAGQSWSVEQARLHPINGSDGAASVIVANVSDDQGKPVTPDRCSEINVRYEYPYGASREPLSYIDGTPGWFQNSSISASRGDVNVTLWVGGTCDGVDVSSTSENLSFRPDGNLSVSLVSDLSGDHVAGSTLSVAWNVTNASTMGSGDDTAFEPQANLSYQLYSLEGGIETQGSVLDGGVSVDADRFSADITLPSEAGLYVLQANATNTSLSFRHPYGGAATTVDVVSSLQGHAYLTHGSDSCTRKANLSCERGATVDVWFQEDAASADSVVAWVNGSGEQYRKLTLASWNGSSWNQSLYLSESLNTSTYGEALTVTVNASNSISHDTAHAGVNISRFALDDSTQQFVEQGATVDLLAGPVTPYTMLPVPRSNVSVFNYTVTDPDGTEVRTAWLQRPFDSDDYDTDARMFSVSYSVPADATTGEYTVDNTMLDRWGKESTGSYTFTVVEADVAADSLQVADIPHSTVDGELVQTHHITGNKTIDIVVENVADVPANASMFFTGDLDGAADMFDEPVSVPAGGTTTLTVNLTIDQAQRYVGDIKLQAHGADVQDRNITVPVNITVGSGCAETKDLYCVFDTDLRHTVLEAGTVSFPVELRNEDRTADVTVTPFGNLSRLLSPTTVTVDPYTTRRITLNTSVDATDNGDYRGTLQAVVADGPAFNRSASLTVDVEPDRPSVGLNVTATPQDLGTVIAGERVSTTLRVNNTGRRAISMLDVTSTDLGIDVTRDVQIGPYQAATIDIAGSAPRLDGSGIITVRVAAAGTSETVPLRLTAYRNFTAAFQRLSKEVESLRSRAEEAGASETVQENIRQLERRIQEGREAVNAGNYDTASRAYSDATSLKRSISESLGPEEEETAPTAPPEGGGGLPVVPIVVLLIILLVVGVILYLSLVPEEEEGEERFDAGQAPAGPRRR